MFDDATNSNIIYPKPLHFYSFLEFLGYKRGDFPIAKKLCKEVVSLPIHSRLALRELKYIVKTAKDIYYAYS